MRWVFRPSEALKMLPVLIKHLEGLPDKKYAIEIKEHKERRSMDANAYFWALTGKLAEKTGIPKTDIYRNLISEIGGNSDIVCVRDEGVERMCALWERNGTGWLTERSESKIKGCTNVTLYYGSSVYDTAQMSRLIDLVVQECKAQGIETLSPKELEGLVSAWR